MTGIGVAVATVASQWVTHIDSTVKLLAGFGGLVVIGLTIFVSLLTARRTSREIAKLNAEIQAIDRSARTQQPSEQAWSEGSP